MSRKTLATEVTKIARAKGGRSKAKQVTIAQCTEVLRIALELIAALPAGDLAKLLRR